MKILKGIVLTIIVFFICQLLVLQVGERIIDQSSFLFSKLYNPESDMNFDIVCFGNSRGVNSFFSPYINDNYNLSAFNCSYNGVELPITKTFIEDYLVNQKKPKTILIEVSSLFNNRNNMVGFNSFNMYSSKSVKINEEIEKVVKSKWINKLFPINKYNSELFYRTIYYLNKTDQNWINDYEISEELNELVKTSPSEELALNAEELKVLKNIVQVLKDKNIEVVLFLAPYLPNYRVKLSNLKSNLDEMQKTVGLEIIDLSDYLNDKKYFADRIHTNKKGAIKISQVLMGILTQDKPKL
jgi:hypothetical protein